MVLYALAILFISVVDRFARTLHVSYITVVTSVAVFLGIPLGAAIITRFRIRNIASPNFCDQTFLKLISP